MTPKRHFVRCVFFLSAAFALGSLSVPAAAQPESENLDVTMRLLPEGATGPDALTKVIELPEAIRARAAQAGSHDARPRPGPAIEDEFRAAAIQDADGRNRSDTPAIGAAGSSGRSGLLSASAAMEASREAAAAEGRDAASRREAVPEGSVDAAREMSREIGRRHADDALETRENLGRGSDDVGRFERPYRRSDGGARPRSQIERPEQDARPAHDVLPDRSSLPDRDSREGGNGSAGH